MGLNTLGQPVGDLVTGWTPPPVPPHTAIAGRTCTLEPLRVGHVPSLWAAFAEDTTGAGWTYLPYGPFAREEDLLAWVRASSAAADPQFYAVVPTDTSSAPGRSTISAAGIAAYLRITPAAGTIEVGHIHFSPCLQQTPAATEAMFLLMRRAFELGYRRYEWKCDALNAPSRRAAQRLGFSYEGLFRQALVVKGRNRDTAWYACVDTEWPALQHAFERWLGPGNFDAAGRQRQALSLLTAPVLVSRG